MNHVHLGDGGLTYVDVLPGSSLDSLEELIAIHLQYFGDSYGEATLDFRKAWEGASPNPAFIEHQWLLHLDGVPCGELVFTINLARRMVDRHFTSVRKELRPQMPDGWIACATQAVTDLCLAEAGRAGVDLLGMMSEILPKHVAGWRRLGLFQPDIGYREPVHGNYWKQFGELQFTPMVANILAFPAGRKEGLGVIAEAGVRSFLLDYYDVPQDNETLGRIVEACRDLPPAW